MSLRASVTCPYCGHKHSEKWFEIAEKYMELICASCDKKFIAEVEVKVVTKKYMGY